MVHHHRRVLIRQVRWQGQVRRLALLAMCTASAMLTATSALFAQVTPPAVLAPSDPALRLWLAADSLVAAGLQEGNPVTQWVDKSQYGTIMSPRTSANPNGPIGPFPIEENPHLVFADINGNSVPTVRFDRDGDIFMTGDPAVDGSGSTDRLYQTNNLDNPDTADVNEDPLAIGDGTDFTHFIVFRPELTTTQGLGWQAVFGKRGTNASLYTLQIKGIGPPGNRGQFESTSYDGIEQYGTGTFPLEKVWHVTSMVIDDKEDGLPNTDTIHFFDDESQSATTKMVDVGAFDIRSNPPVPVTTMHNRNPARLVPEPFGIGGHMQNCCGEGETFAGNIAELIIFARTLSPQERLDVENYLDAKYFATGTNFRPSDLDQDGDVDGADLQLIQNANPLDGGLLLAWQRDFGTGAGGVGAVPEPNAALLCGLVGVCLGTPRRKRRPS